MPKQRYANDIKPSWRVTIEMYEPEISVGFDLDGEWEQSLIARHHYHMRPGVWDNKIRPYTESDKSD